VIAYVDSSVLLRFAFGEPQRLKEWSEIHHGVTSALAEVETLRTLDRLRVSTPMDERQLAQRRETVFRLLEGLEIVEVTRVVLARAGQPLPTALGTLDAIHLASAMLWRERSSEDGLVMATHDGALGLAARACGFEVLGTPGPIEQ
jgi:predicted nucleic acid-binding protein